MYGLRGCEPCVSCMGLGLLKELKFFESMLENQTLPSLLTNSLEKVLNINEISLVLLFKLVLCAVVRY